MYFKYLDHTQSRIVFPEGVSRISDEELVFAVCGCDSSYDWIKVRFNESGELVSMERTRCAGGFRNSGDTVILQVQDTPEEEIKTCVEQGVAAYNAWSASR